MLKQLYSSSATTRYQAMTECFRGIIQTFKNKKFHHYYKLLRLSKDPFVKHIWVHGSETAKFENVRGDQRIEFQCLISKH